MVADTKPPTSTPSTSDSSPVNYYSTIQKKFKEDEVTYDNYDKVQIKLPFRMCLVGASGSGKTNAVINLFNQINHFDKVLLFAKDIEESLYANFIDLMRKVEKETGAQILTVSSKIEDLPKTETINKKNNTLLIVDDMITEKSKMLATVAEYWIRGRKKNVSCLFLSQSYFEIPTLIRKNSSYFLFTKITTDRDLHMILKDFQLGVSAEEISRLYQEATSAGFPNFFLIDLGNDPALRFRKNFVPMSAKVEELGEGKEKEKGEGRAYTASVRGKRMRSTTSAKMDQVDLSKAPSGLKGAVHVVKEQPHPPVSHTKHRKSHDTGGLREYVHQMEIEPDDLVRHMMDTDDERDLMEGDGIGRRKKRRKRGGKLKEVKTKPRIKAGKKSNETEKMIERMLGLRRTPYWSPSP